MKKINKKTKINENEKKMEKRMKKDTVEIEQETEIKAKEI